MKNISYAFFAFFLTLGSSANAQYYKGREQCIVLEKTDALETGDQIFYGTPIANKYIAVLEGEEFKSTDNIEPIDIAYGLYIIADRIGDDRAKPRKKWADRYLSPIRRDKIISAIYRKYSARYLEKCFAINTSNVDKAVNNNAAPVNNNPANNNESKGNISNEGHTTEPMHKTIDQGNNYNLYIYGE